jgi:NADH dehydrogenase
MHILIIGAGYAGLRTALELDKRLQGRANRPLVTLVDQHAYHQDVPLLHLTATAAIPKEQAAIPLETILQRRNVQFRQGRVARIEAGPQRVALDDGQSLEYDRLVIALGSQPAFPPVPGVQEHTLPLRTYDQASHLRAHIEERFRRAAEEQDAQKQRTLLTFVIVGGGFTGAQLTGELAAWVPRLAHQHGVPRKEVRVALVQRSGMLLEQLQAGWASREAVRVLDQRGVSVYLNTAAERVEPDTLFVEGGRMIRASTIVWTTGFRAPALLAESGLPTDKSGRVQVDRFLRVEAHPQISALGDCASIPDGRGGTVPDMASFALLQGWHLGGSLAQDIRGSGPRPYTPVQLGPFVSLGPGEAVGLAAGLPVKGLPAAMIKQSIEQVYPQTLFW